MPEATRMVGKDFPVEHELAALAGYRLGFVAR